MNLAPAPACFVFGFSGCFWQPRASGATFADDFDETRAEKFQYARLTLEGTNIPAPFVVDCYRDTSRQRPFILHSSHNRDAWFDSDTSGVYKQLFLDLRKLWGR